MIFKNLEIKNFRNFENIEVPLDNKNVIFGMNDIGKTNFLYAMRFLLDRDIRKNGFVKTDYHKNNTDNDISILLELDISDFDESEDTKSLVSEAAGVRSSRNAEKFYIKIVGEYNKKELIGEPILLWGDDKENLYQMDSRGYAFSIDNIFKVIYINPLVDLEKLFLKNKRLLMDESSSSDDDKKIIEEINELTDNVNKKIGEMKIIDNLQTEITTEYNDLRNENIEIQMKSEMAIKGFFSDIVPYIKKKDDENYYPTSGDGRRKILSYSILNLLVKKLYEDKIVVYLIEEPENSLHRSMQLALSHQIFSNKAYEYCFISTHSSDILYELDNAMLLRIYSTDKVECSTHLYKINESFTKDKKKLNREFCNALFSERVLLIEGPSEKVLFEKVMNEINKEYELDGGYILQVNGTYFKTYFEAFKGLNIDIIVKTDNDLKIKKGSTDEYELLGINRCLKLIGDKQQPNIKMNFTSNVKKTKLRELKVKRKALYTEKKSLVDKFEQNKIFLSELDLENDLFNVIGDRLSEILVIDRKKVVEKLQSSKLYMMVDVVEDLDNGDCKKIYNSKYFKCLKRLNDE
ncbi:DUF2813 domain-containing protein [Clostridium chromiireducens]|uniref:DUF2813 domain-containing protein n=1 Tax=Clostridium chromiireducens TaxID=225345 RepID=A0A399IKH1_9CLOT|nr:AAA family ATPase [Clostridium chromiireducens]RII33460.1 DUF2813 domain-containing protein [Clostridium chromiireducens]